MKNIKILQTITICAMLSDADAICKAGTYTLSGFCWPGMYTSGAEATSCLLCNFRDRGGNKLQLLSQRQLFGALWRVRMCQLPVVHVGFVADCISLCGALQVSVGVRLQVHASARYFGRV